MKFLSPLSTVLFVVFSIFLVSCISNDITPQKQTSKPLSKNNNESSKNNDLKPVSDIIINKPVQKDFSQSTIDKKSALPSQEQIPDDNSNNTAQEPIPAIDIRYKYKVRGKQYKVFSTADKFQEIGIASWYGPGFHGKKTANGEKYNMHAMTAAHKTLPLGSRVQVTNLENKKKIIVRINDRGPFHQGRVIDLSKKAAKKIDMLKKGWARVHVKVVK